MDEQWLVRAKRADFDAIAHKFDIDKVVARILRNRDLVSDEDIRSFLYGDLSDLHDGSLMKDMDKASFVLEESIRLREHIRIIGDYDVDGICSTYILKKALTVLGANVDTVIPHRITDGYGLNDNLIEDAKKDGVDLILTCDNGIAAKDQVDLANRYGIKVVITDHHEVPYEEKDGVKNYILPDALCIVDPKREDCPYPFSGICGAVVAYKLTECLLDKKGDGYKGLKRYLLPFAALATICDVMELRDENRIIVKYGLHEMEKSDNPGLRALIAVTGLSGREISCYHAGFVLGPCLNATGRLDTAKRAVELFDETDKARALMIATSLKELNDERKKMTEDGTSKAMDIIEQGGYNKDRVFVIHIPGCHESLAGIIAGRIREKYNRPCFVLTDSEEGIKGSGRSIESYDMYEQLTAVKDLFSKFGGHKMAAGISLKSKDLVGELRQRLNDNCTLTDDDFVKKVLIDVPMPLSYITLDLIRSFEILKPFGNGNAKPIFGTKNVRIIGYNRVGANKNVGRISLTDDQKREYDAVFFGDLDRFEDDLKKRYTDGILTDLMRRNTGDKDIRSDILYYPEINSYRSKENIQIVIENYKLCG